MSQDKPGANIQRRVSPLSAPASAPSTAPDTTGAHAPDASARFAQSSHADFGNRVIADSLGGADIAGLGATLISEMALASAGIAGQADQLGSNTILRRVLRDAMHLDAGGKRAVDNINRSGGRPLPQNQLERMNAAFDHDFSHVRVHTGGAAAQASAALNAHAFTLGADVFFGAGEWAPGTKAGDRLIAHELTHVVQHDEGRLGGASSGEGDVEVSNPNEAVELEAYGNESRILAALERVDRMLEAQRAQGEQGLAEAPSVEEPVVDFAEETGVEFIEEVAEEAASEVKIAEPVVDVAEPTIAEPSVATEAPAVEEAAADVEAASLDMPAMADRDHAVPADGSAIERIKRSRGQALPGAVAQKLGALLGHDFSHVRVHTDGEAAKAADALNARAFALGADVFFGSGEFAPGSEEGQELLAHELTHVKQHDEGRLPTAHDDEGMAVSAPSDAAEVEARESASEAMDMAADAGGMDLVEGAAPTAEAHVSADLEAAPAMREAQPQQSQGGGQNQAPGTGEGAGSDRLQVTFGGRTYTLRLPSVPGPGETLDWRPDEIQIDGLSVAPRFKVTFGLDGLPTRGEVICSFAFGSFRLDDITLEMSADGVIAGSGSTSIEVPNLGTAEANLAFTGQSVTVDGTITADNVVIPGVDWLHFDNGTVNFRGDSAGLEASGSLEGNIEALGGFVLDIGLVEGQIAGDFTLTIREDGVQITDQALIESGTLTGSFSPEGMVLTTNMTVNIRDLLVAEVTDLTYSIPDNKVNGRISVSQWPESFALGESVEVSNTVVEAELVDSEITTITGNADYRYGEEWEGAVSLNYDAEQNAVSGSGSITMTEEAREAGIQLGETEGATVLKEADAAITVEENRFVQATGSFRAEVPYENEPTFEVSSPDLQYTFENSALSGTINARTMRQITLGPAEGTQIVVEQDASATGSMLENRVQRLDGGIPFRIQDPVGPVGDGSLAFEMPEGSTELDATATFTLTAPYGFPDRSSTTAFFKQGGTITVTMTAGQLEAATVEALEFTILNPNAELGGQVDGSISGSLDFQTGMVNADGTAALVADWPIPVSFGELTLTEGGNIRIGLAESQITTFSGEMPFSGLVNSEKTQGPITFDGMVNGSFDRESNALTGGGLAQLTAPVIIPLENGDQIRITEGQVAPEFNGEEGLTSLEFSAAAEYHRDGELFLSGTVQNGAYDVATGNIDFLATMTLETAVEKTNEAGTFTFRGLAGSTVEVQVTESALERVGGSLGFEVDDDQGLLLEGNVSDLDLNISEEPKISGAMVVSTARDFTHPRTGTEDTEVAEGYQFSVVTGSSVSGRIEENEVQEVAANLDFRVDLNGGEVANGQVTGTLNMPADEFTGGGQVTVVDDMPLVTAASGGEQGQTPPEPSGDGAGRFESYTAFIAKGSGVDVQFEANELQRANVNIGGFLNRGPEKVAEANLSGEYKLGDDQQGFEGTATGSTIARIEWSEGERFNSFIDEGTTFTANMAASEITDASGTFLFSLDEGGEKKVVINLNANYQAGQGISAEGTVQVIDDILVKDMGEGWMLYLAEGSGGQGKVTNDELESIGGTIKLMLRKDGVDTISGNFGATYDASQGTEAIINGSGTVSVLAPVPMTAGSTGYTFTMLAGTTATCQITNSELDYIDGTVDVAVADNEGDFLRAGITGKYTHGQTDFSGTGSVTVTDERQMASSGSYKLILAEGGGAIVEIAAMDLVSFTATIPLRIDNPEPLIDIQLNGTYVKDGERFDGTGEAMLLRREAVAENVAVGDDTYSFYLEEGTRAAATVENNSLKEVTGTLMASIWDERSEFLFATAQGTYTRGEAESTISVTGTAEITREKLLVEGDEYNVSLVVGSGAQVIVENNQLEAIGGTISTRVDRVGGEGEMGEFATVDLVGTWERDAGFNGRGSAVLMNEFVAGVVGNYTLIVEPGAGAEVELANSEVTKIGGTIPVRLDEGRLQFIRGNLTGDYVVQTEAFSGSGSAEVINAKQLASLGDEQLWLNPGSGANVVVTNNELTEIGGNVNLSLRDGSEYLVVQFGGRFDAAGGTGFTGAGEATVTRDKQLAQIGDYTFFLEPGAGAGADVEQNRLTRVNGNVPFRVNDNEGPLLRGQAEGEYLAETGQFSGNGRVELARDLTFEAGGGVTLQFLQGSGGGGEVVNNELRRLEGTLKVNIGNADGPLIYLEAQGSFDAVQKNIERLEGTMTMLRPFELLDGAIIIDQVTGSALVENNELKEASGGGRITIPDLNNMTGTFNVNYSNQGGTEEYWGDGTINFTLFDEPDKGRSMQGEVSATYNRDGSFAVSGNADYQLNEMIGGSVGVEMDQNMDPLINATLNVNTELVPGKELFRKEMDLIPRTEIIVYPGVALIFGAKGGMGLEMLPLNMQATIGVSNWRPLAQEANVPDFDAELALNWGMNFDALVAAYMAMGLTVGVASASAGIRGEVELDVPLTITPHGSLHGGADGYWGELGIDLNISPTLALRVIPYVDAAIRGMDPFVHDFPGLEMNLENIADFNWGTNYVFGDREEQTASTGGAAPAETGNGSQRTDARHEEEPNMGGDRDGGSAQNAGGPSVSSSDVDKGEEGGGQDGAMGELMETIDKIKIMAEGIGALGELVGLVISLVTAFLTFGPVGLIVVAVWKVFTGELSWDNIVEKIDKVVLAFQTAAEILRPYMPDWLQPIMDAFSGKKPGLLDALFGADDMMRESVAKGEHKYAPTDFRIEMIDTMMSGWCGDADQSAIVKVLDHSNKVGDFKDVVRGCDGGADRIMDKLGGKYDTAASKMMHANGISYSTGW
ncbi:MAG: DUF4157 domain-containing protein [Deltaproteobacteria bacterium]|nr:MAG: DUF4157 domain-containing protein [Deltaproteobacteria bacterium]